MYISRHRTIFPALAALLCAAALPALAAPPAHSRISASRARTTALRRYHGTVVAPVKLENEDGHWQYSVLIRNGKALHEVMVDSHTGRIASVERTSPAEERAEAAADARASHHASAHPGPAHHTNMRRAPKAAHRNK